MISRRNLIAGALGSAGALAPSFSALAEVPSTPERATSGRIIQVLGMQLVEGSQPVRLRGINLGGWMTIEDYMIGLPWTEWKIREQFRQVLGEEKYHAFFGAWAEFFIAEPDIAFLSRQGVNFVRLPLNYRHFESDLDPGKWIEAGFQQMDRTVRLCARHGIHILLDIHAAPGAQARDQNAGSAYGEAYFWYQRDFMDRVIALWTEIARRYQGNPAILGYNLICEPVTRDVDLLNSFYARAIKTVREVDKQHLIVLDPNLWAKDVSSLRDALFEDPQVVPALHHYHVEFPEFLALKEFPAVVNGKKFDRAALERTLDGKHDESRIRRPHLVTEFGPTRSFSQEYAVQLAINRELISIFEEKDWGWSMWCYKDIRHMGLLTPRKDTPWLQFLDSKEVEGFLRSYRALEEPFIDGVAKLLAPTDIDPDTREQWAGEVRRDFDPPALDYVLKRLRTRTPGELSGMAKSFAFDNCDIHSDQLGILKPFWQKNRPAEKTQLP